MKSVGGSLLGKILLGMIRKMNLGPRRRKELEESELWSRGRLIEEFDALVTRLS